MQQCERDPGQAAVQAGPEQFPPLREAYLRYPPRGAGMAEAVQHAGHADHAVVQAEPVGVLGQDFRTSLVQGVEHPRRAVGEAEPATGRREMLDVTGEEPVIAGWRRAGPDRLGQGSPGHLPARPVRRDLRAWPRAGSGIAAA